jgi:hypothetical protein
LPCINLYENQTVTYLSTKLDYAVDSELYDARCSLAVTTKNMNDDIFAYLYCDFKIKFRTQNQRKKNVPTFQKVFRTIE